MLNGQGESIHQQDSYTWGYGYGYDPNGHLASNVYPSNLIVSYAPNALGQPTQVGSYVTGVTYHPSGAVKQFTYGNGVAHAMTPNLRGLPAFAADTLGGFAVLADSYAYDKNGNVVQLTDGASDRPVPANRAMTYDGLDRLKTATSPMWDNLPATYTYNALDNLVRVQMPDITLPDADAPARDRYHCYDPQYNRLTNIKTGSCNGATVGALGYDLQGNVNNIDGRQFDFDFGNRLRRVGTHLSTPSQVLLEKYRYDGLGRRVLTLTPSTGLRVISQYTRDGKLVYQYDTNTNQRVDHLYLGNRLVATRSRPINAATETVEYLHTDGLGSPVAATDAAGNRLRYDAYEPYGLRLNRANDNRPGFTGHVMDAGTGLTYMQQRYYDPQLGRFLSVDPVRADPNTGNHFGRFKYANNSPYRFIDPDGRQEKDSRSMASRPGLSSATIYGQLPSLPNGSHLLNGPAVWLVSEVESGANAVANGVAEDYEQGGVLEVVVGATGGRTDESFAGQFASNVEAASLIWGPVENLDRTAVGIGAASQLARNYGGYTFGQLLTQGPAPHLGTYAASARLAAFTTVTNGFLVTGWYEFGNVTGAASRTLFNRGARWLDSLNEE